MVANTIIIGSDHAGFEMKEDIKAELQMRGIHFVDAGAHVMDLDDDYPVRIAQVAQEVARGTYPRGIALCGAGVGASIAANRYRGVRAALCTSVEMARLARAHNDANILVLGGRTTPKETAAAILDTWLQTEFEGERHQRRVKQLDRLGDAGAGDQQ
jgi:ribose 5-phosphate isomerase B